MLKTLLATATALALLTTAAEARPLDVRARAASGDQSIGVTTPLVISGVHLNAGAEYFHARRSGLNLTADTALPLDGGFQLRPHIALGQGSGGGLAVEYVRGPWTAGVDYTVRTNQARKCRRGDDTEATIGLTIARHF
jgi:hypothetical protein